MRIKHFLLVSIFLLCTCVVSSKNETGQLVWPKITMETKPWTRLWIFGSAMNRQDITAALETYHKAGIGGVEITPIYGVRGAEDKFINYLSSEWVEMLVYILNEAKRIGLGVDLANASGWPFGGPWVDDNIACKNIQSKTFKIKGGQVLSEKIECIQNPLVYSQSNLRINYNEIKEPVTANENQQEYAFGQIRYKKALPLIIVTANKLEKGKGGYSKSINITDKIKNGILNWTAPEGEWLICALFQGYHGKMVERASPGGEGNVIDHFSSVALEKYLKKFDDAFSGHDLSYLRYFFNDSYEVDDASGSSNWTPEMFSEFRRIHGYNLEEYIPALLGLADEDTNRRVLYDYRAAISDLMLEKFTKNWQRWAAKQGKGIRNQSHGSPANVLDLYGASDVPETEGGKVLDIKSASSVSHVMGKKLTSAESCTLLNEHFHSTLGDVKKANDKFLLGGVNHIFYHGTDYSPRNIPWPGWLFYAAVHFTPVNTFWDDFGALNAYVARSQSFLQLGKSANDILLYYGIADLWSTPGEEMFHYFHSFKTVSMDKCAKHLLDNGYTWDAISDKQLLDVKSNKTGLTTGGGNVYKTIIIPDMEYMPLETFEKLMSLAKTGASVLFYKNLPVDIPGLAALKDNRLKFKLLKSKLKFNEIDGMQTAKFGKGKIIISDDYSTLLEASTVKSETMYKKGLQCIRRLKEDGNFYYYILNPSDNEFSDWITLNADYSACALYNPMTGKDGFSKTKRENEKLEVFLQLKPNESIILETFSNHQSGPSYPYYKPAGEGIVLENWNIKFIKGGPTLPPAINPKELKSWTEYGDEYQSFSGTAEYSLTLPALPDNVDAWQFHFDKIHESAAIYVNNSYIGTLIDAPYTLEVPSSIFKGNDILKIKVANLMANRIADMDKKGIQWRIFYNANVESKGRVNVGEDGKFSAEKWNPKPSGILGEVKLIPLSLY